MSRFPVEDVFDSYDDAAGSRPDEPTTTCNRCGQTDLEWVDCGTQWRLYEGDKLHVCKTAAPQSDFQ